MININNKNWEKLRFSDIDKMLKSDDGESFFFEFKNDAVTTKTFISEVSAFSNTYGGYIFLGIDDDKTISGCTKWTEQRIFTTIHDSITPVPNFDVKKFNRNGKTIFVVKIEEGTMPPYITNGGRIFERISSGSFEIKDSVKLTQLYNKRKDQLIKIKNKIEIEEISESFAVESNICAFLDFGFLFSCINDDRMHKNFLNPDFEKIIDRIKSFSSDFSFSKLGNSYLITIGKKDAKKGNTNIAMPAGIHNFVEIMADGSVKGRIVLFSQNNSYEVDISSFILISVLFRDIYKIIFGDKIHKIFLEAKKYEKLRVFKQFSPCYKISSNKPGVLKMNEYLSKHRKIYGDNLIVIGNRFPKNEYFTVDRRLFDEFKMKYNDDSLLDELFFLIHSNLGFINSDSMN